MNKAADILTGTRIVLSFLLLFLEAFSSVFVAVYILAGITDMIDGPVARKMGTSSEKGSRFDSVADMFFLSASAFKIIPALDIRSYIYVLALLILVLKASEIAYSCRFSKKIVFLHTKMNKITGFLLFVFPLTVSFINTDCSLAVICVIALFAAVQELYYTVCGRDNGL